MSRAYICPNCNSEMEALGDTESQFRVCPACGVLQWEEDGKTETRKPAPLNPPEGRFINRGVIMYDFFRSEWTIEGYRIPSERLTRRQQ